MRYKGIVAIILTRYNRLFHTYEEKITGNDSGPIIRQFVAGDLIFVMKHFSKA